MRRNAALLKTIVIQYLDRDSPFNLLNFSLAAVVNGHVAEMNRITLIFEYKSLSAQYIESTKFEIVRPTSLT